MRIFLKEYTSKSNDKSKVTSHFGTTLHPLSLGKECYLLGVISISTDTEMDAVSASRFIWNAVSDQIHQVERVDVESIKSLVKGALLKLNELVRNHDRAEDFKISFDFSICSMADGKLIFAQAGDHKLYVRRGGTLIDISKTLKENNVIGGSTVLNESDIVLVASVGADLGNSFRTGASEKSVDGFVADIDQSASNLKSGEGVLVVSQSVNLDEIINSRKADADITETLPEPDTEASSASVIENLTGAVSEKAEVIEPMKVSVDNPVDSPSISQDSGVQTLPAITPNIPHSPRQNAIIKLKGLLSGRTNKINLMLTPLKKVLIQIVHKLRPILKVVLVKLKVYWERLHLKWWSLINATFGRKLWFKRIKAKISQSRISSPGLRGLKLGEYRTSALRNRKFAALAITVVVIVAVLMGIRAAQNLRARNELADKFDDFYTSTERLLSDAENKLGSDKEAAEISFFKAEKQLSSSELDETNLSDEDSRRFAELKGRVLGVSDKLNKVIPISEEKGDIELYIDGRIDFSDSSDPTDIAIYKNAEQEEILIITDRGSKAVYAVPTYDKVVSKVPDKSSVVTSPVFVDIGVEGIYIFDLTNGVLKASFGNNQEAYNDFTQLSGLSISDFSITKADEFAILTANDNVYVLSKEKQSIIKSQKTEFGSYTLPYTYLSDAKLATGEDFFADVNAYVITSDGEALNRYVFDFTAGKLIESPVTYVDLRTSMTQATAGYTGGDLTKRLYIFDDDSDSLFSFEKPNEAEGIHPNEMVLKGQYLYRGSRKDTFKNVKDIVVDDADVFMYVLDGSKVWKIRL